MTYTLINADGTEQARYEHESLTESIRDLDTVDLIIKELCALEYGGNAEQFELTAANHGFTVSAASQVETSRNLNFGFVKVMS